MADTTTEDNTKKPGNHSSARVRGFGLGTYGAPPNPRGLGAPRGPGNVRGPDGTRGHNLEDDPRGPGRVSGSNNTDCVSSSSDSVDVDVVCTNNAGQLTVTRSDKGGSGGPGGGNSGNDLPTGDDTFPQSATEPTDDNPDDTQPLIVCKFCRLTVYNMPNMPTQRRITPQITTDNNADGVEDTKNDGGNNVSINKKASGIVSTNNDGGIAGGNNAGGPGGLTGPGGNGAGKRNYGLPPGVDRFGRYRTPSGITGPYGGYSSCDYLLGRPFGNPFRAYSRPNVSCPLEECYFCGLAIDDMPTPSMPAADRRRMPPAGNKTNPTQQPGTMKN